MSNLFGRTAGGMTVPVRVDNEGRLETSESGGGDAGDATAAKQDIGNSVLADIETNTAGALSPLETLSARGVGFTSSVSITRPSNTTAYTAGDVIGIADAGTPANPGSAILAFTAIGATAAGHVALTDISLEVDVAAIPSGMTSFRLHLYNASPDAILDNAAWDLSSAGDRGKYLGYVDMGSPVDFGSTLFVQQIGVNKVVKLAAASTTLYGELVTNGAYTPTSAAVKVVTLRGITL